MTTTHAPGVAGELARGLRPFVGGDLPVRLRAWDGSEAGPLDAPLVEVRTPDALRRLLWRPGELGAAQAYVAGEIEVHGDLGSALAQVREVIERRDLGGRPHPAALATAVGTALRMGAVGRPPGPPATQARVRGRMHSKRRDRSAISHHYDLSNEFYGLILDETMAYSCAYWRKPPGTDGYTLADAQRDKLSLVCRKLGLAPGMSLLDVGCGWGSLSLHAAEEHGARVTGVTISAEQKAHIDEQVRRRGLQDRVTIRLQDYRDVDGSWDAVASIEMGEHVGEANYPDYARVLARSVRPGGRVLVQQMSRRGRHPGGGPFIESFIAPDMHMRPVGRTVGLIEDAGLEVRDVHALREHYVWTVDAWMENFTAHHARLRELVGEEAMRVWDLYLVGGRMAFHDGRMGVDQVLAVRPGRPHTLRHERSW
ncbi:MULTISPECIES: class I SAM-dependent methyltransferase [unclassified Nocardioides]|uniref:class I SAM-dependent methyltransferase n=1 Tax=unclassified Nocardioides TaxID=2615069 RepID=UPI003614FF9E